MDPYALTSDTDDGFDFTQGKTDKPLWIPLTDLLQVHLNGLERLEGTVVTDAKGRSVNYRTVAEEMRAIKKKMKHKMAGYYKTHGLRKNATIELYLAGCDDEMVKAVTGHSGVEMLKNMAGRYGKESWLPALKRHETAWNEARSKRESFNACFKNEAQEESE